MRAQEEALRILETALSIASEGVEDAEVSLGGGDLGLTHFEDNQIHPSIERSSEILAVRVVSQGHAFRVETTDLSAQGIQEAAAQARSAISHLPGGGDFVGLPEPQNYWTVDGYDPEAEALGGLERTAVAGRAILLSHRKSLVSSGFVASRRGAIGLDSEVGIYALANTRGLLAYHPSTRVDVQVRITGRNGLSSSYGQEAPGASALKIEELIQSVASRAMITRPPSTVEPGRYVVVLEPAAVSALIKQIGLTCGATDMESGGSFLSDNLSKQILPESINIADDHAHPLHRGAPFDVEGVAKRKVEIISNGSANEPVHSWESAQRLGAEPTGHRVVDPLGGKAEAASHLVFEGGDSTLSDLVGGTKRGILISHIGGIRLLDPRTLWVTGVTQDGLFLIEDGDVTEPISDMRFNVSVLEMLRSVIGMTASSHAEGVVAPALKVEGFPLQAPA